MKKATPLLLLFCLLGILVRAQIAHPPLNRGNNLLEFVPNRGQITDINGIPRGDILYLCQDGPAQVYLREKGISYVINTLTNPKLKPGYVDDDPPGEEEKDSHQHNLKLRDEPFKTCRVDMDFIGATFPETQNSVPTDGFLNFYYPQCPNGITGVKAYRNVLYRNIYPNIDISFKGNWANGFKYDIIVNPGADPAVLRMKYSGTEKAEIIDGKLVFTAYTGKIEEHIPKIYQEINGQEIPVQGKYVIYRPQQDSISGAIVSISVGNYNKAYPLVIDPWWATYCGGTTDDEAYACAIDNGGNTIAGGMAHSTNFPVSVGAFQTSLAGGMDCFVIKFNSVGQRLWATYYGGSSSDGCYSVAADANNNVAFTGNTSSSNFPVTAGAFQPALGGRADAFAVKLNANGARLWATYCGGSAGDVGNSIAFDKTGNVAITGYTSSSNFPVTASTVQPVFGGATDGFIEKFDPNGNRLWGTYLGGASYDQGEELAFDSKGNIAVAGITGSSNFPVTVGAFQTTPGAGFVTEVDSTGTILKWSTYYGAQANGCAIDKSDNVIIAGYTRGGITTTPGVFQPNYTSGAGFAAKFNPRGNRVWATYNNTMQSEAGEYAMTVDEANNVYLEDDEEPPSYIGTSCAFQVNPTNAAECLYIVKLDSNARYACSTYMSGYTYDEHEYACPNLAVKGGRMAIAGFTSGGIPTTPGAFQGTFPGGGYAPYVMNLCSFACGDTLPPSLNVSSINVKLDSCLGYASFSAHGTAPCDSLGAIYYWSFPGGNPSSVVGPYANNILFSTPGTYTVTVKYIACAVDSFSKVITVHSGFHDSLAIVSPTRCNQRGSAIAYPTAGAPPYTFAWSNGATTSADTGLVAGTYTCVVTSHNGCRDTTVFNISKPTKPGFILKPKQDTGYCLSGSVPLLASGGSNFIWSPAAGLTCTNCPNPIASPTVTTVYKVAGLDSLGCPDTGTIKVNVDSIPKFSITSYPYGCGTTLLEAMPPTSSDDYSWTWSWSPRGGLNNPTSYTTMATPSVTTIYTLTASNGYCTGSDTITVHGDTGAFSVKIKAVPDTVCPGQIVHITATSNDTVLFWYWYPGTGLSCTSCYDPSLNTALLPPNDTIYSVYMYAENSLGCISYDTVKIHIFYNHVTKLTERICKDSTITLQANSMNSYLWSNGATTSSISVSPPVNTTYYVVIDSNGCTGDTIYYNVIVDTSPPITIAASADTVNCGGTVSLNASGSGLSNWLWFPSGGLSCTNCNNPTATVNSQVKYYVYGTDSAGCRSKDSITLYSVPGRALIEQKYVCDGANILLTPGTASSYLWSTGATTSSITVSPTSNTTCSVVANINGCPDTIIWHISVNPAPAIYVCCDSTIQAGQSVVLSASGGGSYVWMPATGLNCDTCPKVVASPTVTTTYSVFVTNDSGCVSSGALVIDVNCGGSIFVPDAFSPNNDGQNDILYVRGECIKDIDFVIFDRWGNKVFETKDITQGWDGKYNGEPMNTGTFVYYLQVLMYDNSTVSKKGNVTLVR